MKRVTISDFKQGYRGDLDPYSLPTGASPSCYNVVVDKNTLRRRPGRVQHVAFPAGASTGARALFEYSNAAATPATRVLGAFGANLIATGTANDFATAPLTVITDLPTGAQPRAAQFGKDLFVVDGTNPVRRVHGNAEFLTYGVGYTRYLTTTMRGVYYWPADGKVYITASDQLFQYNETGGANTAYTGGTGSSDGAFDTPRGIAGSATHLYIADSGNDRIIKRDGSLAFVSKFGIGELDDPRGVVVYNGKLYVTDYGHDRVCVYDLAAETMDGWWGEAAGVVGWTAGSSSTEGGSLAAFQFPTQIAVDSANTGNIAVLDAYTITVFNRIAADGSVLWRLHINADSLAYRSNGNLLAGVHDSGNEYVLLEIDGATGQPIREYRGTDSVGAKAYPTWLATRAVNGTDVLYQIGDAGAVAWSDTLATTNGLTLTAANDPVVSSLTTVLAAPKIAPDAVAVTEAGSRLSAGTYDVAYAYAYFTPYGAAYDDTLTVGGMSPVKQVVLSGSDNAIIFALYRQPANFFPAGVRRINIYVRASGASTFQLVESISDSAPTLTFVTYITDLYGTAPLTALTARVDPAQEIIINFRSRLWYARAGLLTWSSITHGEIADGVATVSPTGARITALTPLGSYLFVHCADGAIYRVDGDPADAGFAIVPVAQSRAALSQELTANIDGNALVWCDGDTVWHFDGGGFRNIGQAIQADWQAVTLANRRASKLTYDEKNRWLILTIAGATTTGLNAYLCHMNILAGSYADGAPLFPWLPQYNYPLGGMAYLRYVATPGLYAADLTLSTGVGNVYRMHTGTTDVNAYGAEVAIPWSYATGWMTADPTRLQTVRNLVVLPTMLNATGAVDVACRLDGAGTLVGASSGVALGLVPAKVYLPVIANHRFVQVVLSKTSGTYYAADIAAVTVDLIERGRAQ